MKETCTAPAVADDSGWVAPLSGASPCRPSLKPLMLPVPPALSTYATPWWIVTLFGVVPPEGTRFTSTSRVPRTRNAETSFEPALTASSQPRSSASAPWEPRPAAPVPAPPVA